MLKLKNKLFVTTAAVAGPELALAAELPTDPAFMFNTLFVLLSGVLVMFMAAGFAMLEAGMVRSKSVATICTKNIGLYSVASFMFLVCGYNLMYLGVDGGFIGTLAVWETADDPANLTATMASAADWFFQMVFVATAASIVSGTLAERIKFWPFLVFTAVLTGLIYPMVGAWKWGGGWLDQVGFLDFAGSSIVHSVGGWAALVGAILLGPRVGRFSHSGVAKPMPSASLAKVTLGTFILWMGWFGFNGGSQLAIGSAEDAIAVANIFANTNAAAAGGVIATMLLCQFLFHRLDLPLILNGALAGLVSITAEPLTPSVVQATAIGAAGGVLMVGASSALERLRIDDVVGAIPVHLVAGIWGTLAVVLTNPEASLVSQVIGIMTIAAFVVTASFISWSVIRYTMGLRLHRAAEIDGADMAEMGVKAYNLG